MVSWNGAYGRVIGVQDVQTLRVFVDVLEDVDLTPSWVVLVAHGPAILVSTSIRYQYWLTYKAGQIPHACWGTW